MKRAHTSRTRDRFPRSDGADRRSGGPRRPRSQAPRRAPQGEFALPLTELRTAHEETIPALLA